MTGTMLAMERMPGNPNGGVIINTGSMASFLPADIQESTSYHVSKHGVLALTKSLGTKAIYKEKKVRIASICPFFVSTDIIKADEEIYSLVKKELGESHIMSVEYVAEAFIKLVEEEGNNGSALCVFPHVRPFYWPIFAWGPLYWLLGNALLGRLIGIKVVTNKLHFMCLCLTLMFLYILYSLIKY